MLEQSLYAWTNTTELRELVSTNSWVTLASNVAEGSPVISHLPVLSDPQTEQVVILGHLARADAEFHELGKHPVTVIVEGPNGYISPTFYEADPYVPTWDFMVAHLHGVPEILSDEETYSVLSATVDHFENQRPDPWRLASVGEYAHEIAPYTVGFRLKPDRVVGKAKLSQEKPAETIGQVVRALEADRYHGNTKLAQAIRKHVVTQ